MGQQARGVQWDQQTGVLGFQARENEERLEEEVEPKEVRGVSFLLDYSTTHVVQIQSLFTLEE